MMTDILMTDILVTDLYPTIGRKRRPKEIRHVTFVDPGIIGTGMAWFEYLNFERPRPPLFQKDIIPTADWGDWQEKAFRVAAVLERWLSERETRLVVMEAPELWEGSALSYAAATNKTRGEPSSLFKLMYLVGLLGDRAMKITKRCPVLMAPADWKGQLPKDAVLKRISRAWPKQYPDWRKIADHMGDAIGMGLAAQGGL